MKRQGFTLAILAGAILLTYIWFISDGQWTRWPATTGYYDQLATSFRHGRLELALQPDASLLALPDPYEHSARRDLPSPWWDMSLYNGKFYLYWGPVPALLLALIKFLVPLAPSDAQIVFVFACGLFLFISLLLAAVWQRFFRSLPGWTLWAGIVLAGLVCPLPWMLARPKIYEAAIAGAQFFFIGGLYWNYLALTRPSPSARLLALGSIFWACAVGSRATMALPVVFMEAVLLYLIARTSGHASGLSYYLPLVLATGLPLMVAALGLVWYNQARFGSPFEFGIRYMLTTANFNKYRADTFSLAYVPVNLRNYLVNPFRATGAFPFIRAIPGAKSLPAFPDIPKIYGSELVTGLLYCLPFALFSLLAVAASIAEMRKSPVGPPGADSHRGSLLSWMSIGLAGAVLLSLASMLLFRYASMRYLADITPSLLLLSLWGFWQGGLWLDRKPLLRSIYLLLGLGLAAGSVLISALLAIAGYPA